MLRVRRRARDSQRGDLPLEEAVGLAEVGEADGLVVDRAEAGQGVDGVAGPSRAGRRVAGVERRAGPTVALNPSIGSIR